MRKQLAHQPGVEVPAHLLSMAGNGASDEPMAFVPKVSGALVIIAKAQRLREMAAKAGEGAKQRTRTARRGALDAHAYASGTAAADRANLTRGAAAKRLT